MEWLLKVVRIAPVCLEAQEKETLLESWRKEILRCHAEIESRLVQLKLQQNKTHGEVISFIQLLQNNLARKYANMYGALAMVREELKDGILLVDQLYRELSPEKTLRDGKFVFSFEIYIIVEKIELNAQIQPLLSFIVGELKMYNLMVLTDAEKKAKKDAQSAEKKTYSFAEKKTYSFDVDMYLEDLQSKKV